MNPLNILIEPKDTWVKVATSIKKCLIEHEVSTIPNHYKYTYVDTGTASPTSTIIGIRLKEQLDFNHSTYVDLYIMAVGGEGVIQAQL